MNSIKYMLKNLVFRMRGDYTTEKLILMGLKVGKNFTRMNGTILDPSHCWLITIGDNVTIAPRVHILAHDASTCSIVGYAKIGRVNIGNNVFIGAESIVLPNTSIGNDVVIGAGSVVTKNIPSGSVAVGNPARIIMSYNDYCQKIKSKLLESPIYDESYTLRSRELSEQKKMEMYNDLNNTIGFVK
jgi:maltose O-acetyltransferase